jgi:hypothetical protein
MTGSRPGFDAIIGNPPFLGGQEAHRCPWDQCARLACQHARRRAAGSADLVAYFFLRAQGLLKERGTVGLIATNTIAQGDTREVGLDRMVESGLTITRAIQSRSWPAKSANLEYAARSGARSGRSPTTCRGCATTLRSPASRPCLEPEGRVTGNPIRLAENVGHRRSSAATCSGWAFVLDPDEAEAVDRRGSAQRRGALPIPQRRRPELPPGRFRQPLGHRLHRQERSRSRSVREALREASAGCSLDPPMKLVA